MGPLPGGRVLIQSHLRARMNNRAGSPTKTAAYLNASLAATKTTKHNYQIREDVLSDQSSQTIIRTYNFPSNGIDGWNGEYLYPSESPLNFTPLQHMNSNLMRNTALGRAVREVPVESNLDIISSRRIIPEFASESIGTPRREYQGGMINGVRIRAVPNPYFKPTGQIKKQFDTWRSRNWLKWNPFNVAVRGSGKLYSVPRDISLMKDELGEWNEPALSGRYQADIKRQYVMNGLPWIYKKDFRKHKVHILDKEPIGPKRWYKREYRIAKIHEAMRSMNTLVDDYRKEKKAAKKKTWFEQIVQKLVGNQLASKYINERKIPKL